MTGQIIEFELTGPGPPGCTCAPTNGYFYEKEKSLKENISLSG